MHRFRTLAVATALLVALAATACGNDTTTADTTAATEAPADTTAPTGTTALVEPADLGYDIYSHGSLPMLDRRPSSVGWVGGKESGFRAGTA